MCTAIHVPTVAWDIMRLKLAAESWETLGVEEQFEISGISGYIGTSGTFFLLEQISVPALFVQRRQSCVSIAWSLVLLVVSSCFIKDVEASILYMSVWDQGLWAQMFGFLGWTEDR